MEATEMSINRWMNKEVMVHTHNGILLSYKKEHIRVNSDEVDDPRAYVIQSEVNQKEKNKYCILILAERMKRQSQSKNNT